MKKQKNIDFPGLAERRGGALVALTVSKSKAKGKRSRFITLKLRISKLKIQ